MARAAFAVILKFCQQEEAFRSVWDEVEMLGLSQDDDLPKAAKARKILQELKKQGGDDFEYICKMWESASMIRKWTQDLKTELMDKISLDCEQELIKEINAQMVEEKRKRDEEEAAKKAEAGETEEEKKEDAEDKTVADSEDGAKMIDTEQKADGEEEKKGEDEEEEKKEEEEDDDDDQILFNGPLNEEQKALAEERADKKLFETLDKNYTDSINRAKLLLKMQVPENYKQTQA